jgi:hypothetical protein
MKVMLTLVTMSVLVLGAGALQCHECAQTKVNGEEVAAGTVACNEDSRTTCADGQDACVTVTQKYKVTILDESAKGEVKGHACGKKSDKDGMKAICNLAEKQLEDQPGFSDYDCDVDFCETDLCNSGNAAQICLILLAATIVLFGLFF